MQSYRDLEIYTLSHKLALDIHKMTLLLPSFEAREEGSQIRRSSKGISSAIVEGFGRKRYRADYVRFLVYAHASCDETMEHLAFLHETGSLKDKKSCDDFQRRLEILSKKINKFIQAVCSQFSV